MKELTDITLTEARDLGFTFYEEHPGKIKSYESTEVTDVIIPEKVNGVPITSIGKNSFIGRNLTSVVIPDTVTEIGEAAFANNYLKTLKLPTNLRTVYESAFEGNNLTTIELPEGLVRIADEAFKDNKLTTINLPQSLRTLEWKAFANNSLREVTVYDTSVANDAFSGNPTVKVTIEKCNKIVRKLNNFMSSNIFRR